MARSSSKPRYPASLRRATCAPAHPSVVPPPSAKARGPYSSSTPTSRHAERRAPDEEHWLLVVCWVCAVWADVGQRRAELLAGADPELAEHLGQVPFHGS